MKLTGWIFAAVLLLTLPFVGLQISERAEGLERRLTHERVAAGAKEKRLNEEIAARDRRIWELEKTQSALQVEIKKKQDAVDLAVIRAEKLAGERVKDRAEIEKIQAAANASPASALPQSSSPAAALTTAPEPTGLPAAPAPAALKPYIESLSKMMEDPAMKEPLQQKRAEDIAQQWAPFLEKIDPVVAQQFKEKQLVHLQKLLELGRAFTDGAATADRVTQYADAVKAAQDGLEDNLRSLLGPMGYERYQSYQKTIPMRSQIEMLKNYGFEVPDAAKKERLVTAMSEALQELNPQGCGTGAWPAVGGREAYLIAL